MAESTSKTSKATRVPEGHRRVRWLFNPRESDLVGTVVDMPTVQAQILAGENRVAYVEESTPLGKQEQETKPTVAPIAGATADTSGGRDTGSTTAAPSSSR